MPGGFLVMLRCLFVVFCHFLMMLLQKFAFALLPSLSFYAYVIFFS